MSKYELRKKLRYVYVSLFTAPIGQVLLFLFYEVDFGFGEKGRSQIFAMKLCLIGCLLF